MSTPTFPSERREHSRQQGGGRVRIVLATGHVFDADLVDRSLKGMRIRLEEAATLPLDVSVLSVAGAAVYTARVVWRSAPYAGLSIVRTVDMRASASAGEVEAHRLWREHAGR